MSSPEVTVIDYGVGNLLSVQRGLEHCGAKVTLTADPEQILSAQGEKLRYKQSDITFRGHSIECRINAEDPRTSMPSPGLVTHYHRPGGIGIRVDDYIYSGYSVLPYYDSMLAKIIVLAPTRDDCIRRMQRALNEMVNKGIQTNTALHERIMEDPDFRGNNYSTNFISLKMS